MNRIEPGPGQESVWDYPRPPRLAPDTRLISVMFGGRVIAETTRSIRVLETSQAPAFYIPPDDVNEELLGVSDHRQSFCEWKGVASYVDVVLPTLVSAAAGWRYLDPAGPFREIAGWYAFYCGRVERCSVAGHVVSPNDGDFYGGWITPDVVGPFKGGAGTSGW